MREADWLSIEEALRTILMHVQPLQRELVPLEQSLGRTLAEAVISPVDQPPWDNSAMDGYAVHAVDVREASEGSPVLLRVIEEVRAGGFPALPVQPGEATRIMTGAPVPSGVDSVVRVEHTRDGGGGSIEVYRNMDAGRNIRLRGEDLHAGENVFAAGRLLRPAEVGVLAMIGSTQVTVTRRPRVAVLATGDELVDVDGLASVLAGTHIINSNTPAVAASLTAMSCIPEALGIARDDRADLRRKLERALDADALITTAGASVGEHDLVKDALEEIGCTTLFWRVRIRPGSPFSFGLIPRQDAPPLPVFGLPGNPVSVMVTFEILVRPALRRMLGRSDVFPPTVSVTAGHEMHIPAGLVRFQRVRLERSAAGLPVAHLTGPQGSGILTSVAAADALLVVPLEVEHVPAGTVLRAVPLGTSDDAQDVMGF
ncbi:molybdopterin molybdotransferase MoeA [soil metagenome]